MSHRFTSVLFKEGRWYVARCLELGVVTQGKTIRSAQKNLLEAVELYLEDQPCDLHPRARSTPVVRTFELQHA